MGEALLRAQATRSKQLLILLAQQQTFERWVVPQKSILQFASKIQGTLPHLNIENPNFRDS